MPDCETHNKHGAEIYLQSSVWSPTSDVRYTIPTGALEPFVPSPLALSALVCVFARILIIS